MRDFENSMRIGVFGGSFNPVHRGHLRLARAALSTLDLDRVIFVPSFQNPLKKNEELLPAQLRIRLLRIAVKAIRGASVSLCEIERRGPSFTVDTLKYFRRRFGSQAALYFLTGADTLKTIDRWKSVDEIFKLCRLVVMTRPRYALEKTSKPVVRVSFAALAYSSTEVRARLRRGQTVAGMVPRGTERALVNYFDKLNKGGLKSKHSRKLI
ncbi:MAG: nicotinate (nicotinamide) nucleotide adenylyltransferase [Candidatus Omnitrophica bacterium CG07_land_8_20_14_0_80_50_8]|nr:MAG: nicotinate (nicotinamide) nucleotide adenylyltransferase [Candidatus Omnitrophica bacterium CG07_land_8_20_14_0_80_50_8]